jgi:hypothetical protein
MEQSSDRGDPRDESTDRTDHRPEYRPAHRPTQPPHHPSNPPHHSSNPPSEQRPSRPSDRPEHWPDSWFAGPPYPEPRQPDPRQLEGRVPPRDPEPIPRWGAGEQPHNNYPDRYPSDESYGPNSPISHRSPSPHQPVDPNPYRSTGSPGRSDSYSPRLPIPQDFFQRWGRGLGIWVVGSLVLAGLVLLLDPSRVISRWSGGDNSQCQEVVQPQSILSREQLVKLLAIPERSAKSKIRQILREPYCYLASLKIRAGVLSQREAYPLEFDTDMWLVILYEGEEYAGYRFSPR